MDTKYIMENIKGYVIRTQDFDRFGLSMYGLELVDWIDYEQLSADEYWLEQYYKK